MNKNNFTTHLVLDIHGAVVLEVRYGGITLVGFVSAKSDCYKFRTADGGYYGEANSRKEAIAEVVEYAKGMVR